MSKKISQLEEKIQLTGDEYIVLQEGTTNKKAKVANLPKQDLSGYAKRTEIPDISGLATKDEIGDIESILDNIIGG